MLMGTPHDLRVADYLIARHGGSILGPGEHSVWAFASAMALAARMQEIARGHGLRVPLERWHEQEPPRAAGLWSAALHRAMREEIDLLYGVVRSLPWREPLPAKAWVQHPPKLRFRPPGSLGAEFHTDAWARNPADQLIIWVPLVDVVGEEGLWLTPPSATGVLETCAFAEAQRQLRQAAKPLPMSVGEVLLMDATTGHGAPRHSTSRTRVSVDIRISLSPPGPLAWRSADASVIWGSER